MSIISLQNSEVKITPIIMGCWQIGGKPHWNNVEDKLSTKAILSSVDAGINTFDTAPVYGDGHSERMLGNTLNTVQRDQVVIATKVGAENLAYHDVIKSCECSLKNLKTDYIDLLQIHSPSGAFGTKVVPMEETMSAFSKLKNEGKIKAMGVSNFSLLQLQEAAKFIKISCMQIPYSIFWRHAYEEIVNYCSEKNIAILAYSPLAQGLLSGKFRQNDKFDYNDIRSHLVLAKKEHFSRVQEALNKLYPIAEKNNMSLSQLALTWINMHLNVAAIVGIRTPKQSYDNAKTMKLSISQEDYEKINKVGLEVAMPLKNESFMWSF